MIRVDREDLHIAERNEIEKINSYLTLQFAEDVHIFIVDENGIYQGMIEGKRVKGRIRSIEEVDRYLDHSFFVINENEMAENVARKFLVLSKKAWFPVTDSAGKLLYAYFHCTITRLLPEDEMAAEGVLIRQYYEVKKRFNDKKIYVYTNYKVRSSVIIMQNQVQKDAISKLKRDPNHLLLLACYEANEYLDVMDIIYKNKIQYVAMGSGCTRSRRSTMENSGGVTDYISINPVARRVLEQEHSRGGRYFCLPDMENICQAIEKTRHLPGQYVEIGTFRGDTARLALRYMHEAGIRRSAFFLDTYEGFTYEAAKESSDALWDDTHKDTSIELVKARLQEFEDAHCIKSNIITDDLPDAVKEIAVCNIDVDIYEAVYAALCKVKNRIVKGGYIIAEDYGHMPELAGANYAVNCFLKKYEREFASLYLPSGQIILIRL